MIRLIYTLLFLLIYPLLLPGFLLRMLRRGGYRRHFGQRFGCFSAAEWRTLGEGDWIWIHAVSVGEIQVALNFLRAWREREPGARFVLSHSTSTGRAQAEKGVSERDFLLYVPIDLPWIVRRVARRIRPRLFVLTESEFWPNLLHAVRATGAPVALINGRISDRSFPRYRRVRWLTRAVFPLIDRLHLQSARDAERITALGAPADRVRVSGNGKYDHRLPEGDPAPVARARLAEAGFPADAVLLVAGSTWPGEEKALAEMLPRLRAREPRLRLVLVPRHAERAAAVRAEVIATGRTLRCRVPLPETVEEASDPEVFLLNSTGELLPFYAAADLVFVGKSLFEPGGQNIIEPALFGKPIVTGPHLENFAAVARDFLAAGALVQVPDARAVEETLAAWLADPTRARAQGARAADLVRRNAGALTRMVDDLLGLARPPASAPL
jgi:3-deoxy-D-manno-octulosonic-acid transferase